MWRCSLSGAVLVLLVCGVESKIWTKDECKGQIRPVEMNVEGALQRPGSGFNPQDFSAYR